MISRPLHLAILGLKFRPTTTWTIGEKKANIVFPFPPPPHHRLRGGGKRENGAQTVHRHQIFKENLPGVALPPESARNRMATNATQRLLARSLPHCGHCPQGTSTFIGSSYALIMSKRSSVRAILARWTKLSIPTPSPTRFGSGPKTATARERRNRTPHPDRTHTIR